MQTPLSPHKISVTWRGKKFVVEMNLGATVKELGQEVQKLTNIQEDTMRLIIPQVSNKTSKLLSPFSTEHAFLSLQEASITEAKSIKMMGVSTNEVEQILQDAKANLRVAGFEDEEKRLKQRSSYGPHFSLKLPQGPYIFNEFRTLEIPGVKLNPPPSEALKRMHMLAADPGIVAVMNKHHWRVGIMTEMAPIGYVGVSPKCILGFNKNRGEEISLRLRTDDLRGFRKYESIKKTLLHELAHMVYSEHDADFYAFDKQLNQEAASLDWTRSVSHTLRGFRNTDYFEDDYLRDSGNIAQKLGGNRTDQLLSARASSIAAAYQRMTNISANEVVGFEVSEEPDPDDANSNASDEPDHMNSESTEFINVGMTVHAEKGPNSEPDPGDITIVTEHEPDPDDSLHGKAFSPDVCSGITDTDELEAENNNLLHRKAMVSDSVGSAVTVKVGTRVIESRDIKESPHDEPNAEVAVWAEPDPDDVEVPPPEISTMQTDEPDPDDQELQRINDPVTFVCNRVQKTLKVLRAEFSPMQTASVFQTLLKIIRNVIEHPEESKYKRLRKANPVIKRNVVNNKAALEILLLVGFMEDVIFDEAGKAEAYLVLKRNDPGLLWLAKSSLESCLISRPKT